MALSEDAATLVETLRRRGARYELDVMRRLLAALGSPESRFPVVLVAGTNGKGSVASLLASLAFAAGIRAGLYTSPQLEEVEECFRVDGRAIDSSTLGTLLVEVVAEGESGLGVELTYFEAFTAAALLWFARFPVELAILEVGLGGRLDATNACDPVLSIVTSIGRDHLAELGPDLASIARHKAGIFRPGRPALAAQSPPEAMAVLRAEAERLGTRLRLAPRVEPYPAANSALAVLAAQLVAERGFPTLDADAVRRGLLGCRWPGRLEWVEIPGRSRVLLDGAHNPAGAEALAETLRELGQPYDLLFGVFRDKEVGRMLPALASRAGRVWLTSPPGPRGLPAAELGRWLSPELRVEVEGSLVLALDTALATERLLVVCGSLALVGEVRRQLRMRFGVPAPASDPLFGPEDKMVIR